MSAHSLPIGAFGMGIDVAKITFYLENLCFAGKV